MEVDVQNDFGNKSRHKIRLQCLENSDDLRLVRKIHNHFHCPNDKLVAPTRKASASYPEHLIRLMARHYCRACATFEPTPGRCIVSTPRGDDFNAHIQLDLLIYRKGVSITHFVCTFARLSSGDLLPDRGAESIMDSFIVSWLVPYGPPRCLTYDPEGGFIPDESLEFCSGLNIHTRAISKEPHNKIGFVEKANHLLEAKLDRIVGQKRLDEDRSTPMATKVKPALAAKNAMAQGDGLRALEVAFGKREEHISSDIVPFVLARDRVQKRLQLLEETRKHRMAHDAKERLQRALDRKNTAATVCLQYFYGDFVDIFDKKSKKWSGPSMAIYQDARRKQVWLKRNDRIIHRAVERMRRHVFDPEQLENMPSARELESFLDAEERANSAGYLTTVTEAEATGPGWAAADKKEIDGIAQLGTSQAESAQDAQRVAEEDVTEITSGVVRVIKDDSGKTLKTRWVAKEAEWKSDRVRDRSVPTPCKEVWRILLTLVLLFQGALASIDVKPAFAQGDPIKERFYLKLPRDKRFCELSPPEFKAPGTRIRIVKPLYGMKDSGNRWIRKFFNSLKKHGFKQNASEPCFWYKEGRGFLVVYVDDVAFVSVNCGIDGEIAAICREFKIGKCQSLRSGDFKFVGQRVYCENTGKTTVDMNECAQRVQKIALSLEEKKDKVGAISEQLRTAYRGLIGVLSWLGMHVKPVLCCVASVYASKVTDATHEDIIELNKVVEKFDTENNRISFCNINLGDRDEVFLYVYSDASLAHNPDSSTQAGYVIFIGNDHDKRQFVDVNIIAWASRKLRRVTKSTLASELLSFDEAIDRAIFIKYILSDIFKKAHLVLQLDCKSILANIFSVSPQVAEQRLKTTLDAVKQTLEKEGACVFHVDGIH